MTNSMIYGGKANSFATVELAQEQYSNGPQQTAPQIGVELEHLHKAVAHITDQVHSLLEQIGPVMAPVDSKVLNDQNEPPRLPMSPIACNLAEMTMRLQSLAHELQMARGHIQL